MPYFLDFDFYLQTSSAKSALVNNALLPVPAHLGRWRDLFQIPSLFLTCQRDRLSEEQVDICVSNEIADSLVHDLSPLQVVDFEREYNPDLLEDEVIPSSYPESDSSTQFYIDPGIMTRSLGGGDVNKEKAGGDLGSSVFKAETFVRTQYIEEYQELEVPIMSHPFRDALSKLLVIEKVMQRLQALPAEDPVLKPDKTPWTEVDLFGDSHEQLPFEAPSFHDTTKEEYLDVTVNKRYAEEFMLPAVKENSRHDKMLYDFYNTKTVEQRLGFELQSFAIDDIAEVNNECFIVEDASIEKLGSFDLSTFLGENNIQLLSDFKKEDISTPDGNDLIDNPDRHKSPVFGFPAIRAPDRPGSTLNYFNDSRWKLKLDPFRKEDIVVEWPLLTKKEYRHLKLDLWESERHFDEERLPEPSLPKPELSNPLARVKELFPLSPEMDSLPHNKDVLEPDTHKHFRSMEDPLKEIVSIGSDLQMPSPPPVETFMKPTIVYQAIQSNDENNHDSILSPSIERPKQSMASYDVSRALEKIPAQEDHQSHHFVGGDNPLEFFMQFRSNSTETNPGPQKKSVPRADTTTTNDDIDVQAQQDVEEAKSACVTKINLIKVIFAGPHLEVLKCLEDFIEPYFDKIKQRGLIPHDQAFYNTSVDKIRFLMKENTIQSHTAGESSTDLSADIVQSLSILLRTRQTIHLLVHSCLPSAIHHIASFNQSLKERGSSHALQERLLQFQYSFQLKNINHPKMDTLVTHLNNNDQRKTTALILVQHGLMSLVSEIERVLIETTSKSVDFVKKLDQARTEHLGARVVISFESSLTKTEEELFDQIIQFDASKSSVVKDLCQEMGKEYLGLVSDYSCSTTRSEGIPTTDLTYKKTKSPLTVISSVEMMQHQQLIYILEARHNILVIERNYTSLQLSQPVPYADVIFSLEVSLLLLPLLEIGTRDWDMETFTKRLIGVGLQTRHCFILVHGIGAPSRYPLDKTVLQNLYRLRSSLSNLSTSSASFVAQYKVLIALTQEDVVTNVVAIAEYSLSTASNDEVGDTRQWIKPDATQDEEMLLQMVCLNSFSAQLLLSKLSLVDILTMLPEQIKESFPHFPEAVLTYFHHLTSQLKSDQMSSSGSSSQMSAKSTSQKSGCSTSSNPLSDALLSPAPLPVTTSLEPRDLVLPYSTSTHSSNAVNVLSKGTGNHQRSDAIVDKFCINESLVRGDDFGDNALSERLERASRITNRSNKASEKDSNILMDNTSKTSNWNRYGNNCMDISGDCCGDFIPTVERQRKRTQFLNNTYNNVPSKRYFDSVDLDKHLVKGKTARQQSQAAKRDNLVEISHDRDLYRPGRNMIEVCYDPEIMNPRQHAIGDMLNQNDVSRYTSVAGDSQENRNDAISKHANYSFQDTKGQENKTSFQPKAETIDNNDDSQAIFFLGKSQGSPEARPHYDNINEDDDDDEISIILVKSQESRRNMEFYNNDHMNHPRPETAICSMLSDQPVNDISNVTNSNTLSPLCKLPGAFQKPLSLSVVKPLSVPDDYTKRLNPAAPVQPSPHTPQNMATSSSKYGIFSAKVGRRVSPLPPLEPPAYPNTSIHDSHSSSFYQDDSINLSHSHSKPVSLPDVNELPFSVSWDLRKHIMNSKTSSINDRPVHGERISRIPFELRENGGERGVKLNPSITEKSRWLNIDDSSSLNRDFNAHLCSVGNEYKTNQTSSDIPHHLTTSKITIESQHPTLKQYESDVCSVYGTQDSIGYHIKSASPSDTSLYSEKVKGHNRKTGISEIRNIHHETSSVANYPYCFNENESGMKRRSKRSAIPPLGDNDGMYPDNMSIHSEPSCLNSFSNFSGIDEQRRQKEVNLFESQPHCTNGNPIFNKITNSRPFDNIDKNNLINFKHALHQSSDYDPYMSDRHPQFQRSDGPLHTIQTHRNTQDLNGDHPAKGHYGSTGNSSSPNIPSNLYRAHSKNRDAYFSSNHNNARDCDDKVQPTNLHGPTNTHKRQTSTSYAGIGDDISNNPEMTQSHSMSMSDNNHVLYRDRKLRKQDDSLPKYRDHNNSSRPLPQHLPTNALRLHNLPYTPRRNISVGLAQPLQRSQENTSNSQSSSHSTRKGPSTCPTPTINSQSSSPPMDLGVTWDSQSDTNRTTDYKDGLPYTTQMANKMKRWSSHLQKHANQRYPPGDQQDPERGEFPPKQKRLCMEKGGDKGQMLLALK